MIIKTIVKIGKGLFDCLFEILLLVIFFLVGFRRLPEVTLLRSVIAFAAILAIVITADRIISKKHDAEPDLEHEIIISEGFYICASYYKYMPLISIAAPSVMLLIFLFSLIGAKRRKESAYKAAHSGEADETQYAKTRRIAFWLMCAVFAVSMLLAATGGMPLKDYVKNRFTEKEFNSEPIFTVESCGRILANLEDWDSFSLNEREELMQLIADVESDYLGLSERLIVAAGVCDDNVAACYVPNSHGITVDELMVMDPDWQYVLECILHECYHAYQYQLIALYFESPQEYRKLKVFEHVDDYIWETVNYVDDGSYEYDMQALEREANIYAGERMDLYLAVIEAAKPLT